MRPGATDALIVTDIQRDFCPGGALAVSGGDEIIPAVNRIVGSFEHVVFTRDWHPANHVSFSATPQYVDMSWPVHCVAGTPGAELHPDLAVPPRGYFVNKATRADLEAYSSFQDTGLAEELRRRGVKRVFLCGLATDYCVKHSALDAARAGFETVVLEDVCRGVDVPPGTAAAALRTMAEAGVRIGSSEEIES